MSNTIINQFAIIQNQTLRCYDYDNFVTAIALEINTKNVLYDAGIKNIEDLLSMEFIRISKPVIQKNGYIHYQIGKKSIDAKKLNTDVFTKLKNKPKDFYDAQWYATPLTMEDQRKNVPLVFRNKNTSHTTMHFKHGRAGHINKHACLSYLDKCKSIFNEPIIQEYGEKIVQHQHRHPRRNKKFDWFDDDWEVYTSRNSTGWKSQKRRHQYKIK